MGHAHLGQFLFSESELFSSLEMSPKCVFCHSSRGRRND